MVIVDEREYEIDGHKIVVVVQKGQIDIRDEDGNVVTVHKRKGRFILKLIGSFEFRQKI
jgi:hypothetical protein